MLQFLLQAKSVAPVAVGVVGGLRQKFGLVVAVGLFLFTGVGYH